MCEMCPEHWGFEACPRPNIHDIEESKKMKCVLDDVQQVDPKTGKVLNPKVYDCNNPVKYLIETKSGEKFGYCEQHGSLWKFESFRDDFRKRGGEVVVIE